MVETDIAGLRTLLAGGPDREGGGDGPLVCLLHGYGASGDDLAGLWRVLDVPRETRFAFPQAPLSLQAMFGFPAFAWWPIDVSRFQAVLSSPRPEAHLEALMNEEPPGLLEARERVLAWLAALVKRFGGLPLDRVVLGGFSQGAMLSVDVALHLPVSLAGLCLLSGALINRKGWEPLLGQAHGAPRFQAHGTADPLLPFAAGEALHRFLSGGPFPGSLYRFSGGHEISPGVIEALGQALTAWLS